MTTAAEREDDPPMVVGWSSLVISTFSTMAPVTMVRLGRERTRRRKALAVLNCTELNRTEQYCQT